MYVCITHNICELQQGLASTLLWLCKNPTLAMHDRSLALHEALLGSACLFVCCKTSKLLNMTMAMAGWEGVMRVRCSKGLSISQFHGHFFVRSIDLLSLPQVSGSGLESKEKERPHLSIVNLVRNQELY